MKGDIVSVEETENSLKIWIRGELVHNYHGLGYEALKHYMRVDDPLTYILQTVPRLLPDFIQQLREMGLFKPEEDKEKPLSLRPSGSE